MRRRQPIALTSLNCSALAVLAAVLATGGRDSVVEGATPRAATQSVVSREYTIKAAYLYNFGSYVRWADGTFRNDQDPFVIGVLGTDPFGKDLDRIAQTKRVDGRRIVVRRFATFDRYGPCHILFVPKSVDPKRQLKAIERLRESPLLLVGETPAFAQRGGTINFFIEKNKIRFEINQQAAKRAGLKISAKLLSLAKLVKEDGKSYHATNSNAP